MSLQWKDSGRDRWDKFKGHRRETKLKEQQYRCVYVMYKIKRRVKVRVI